jgi:hypothetical protein
MRFELTARPRTLARRAAYLALLLAAGATVACESVTAVQRDGTFPLQVGDRAKVNNGDFVVRFLAVPQDSRCAIDVVCPWAGDALVRLEVTSSHRTRTVDLHTNTSQGDDSYVRDGHVVELLELTPDPRAGQPIDQSEYTARLRISRF